MKQKAAIIGAGINGLYLAKKLAEKGHSVTVFEKKTGIGKKACSGLFSERILQFIPESKKLIKNQIDSVLIHFPKKTLKVDFSRKFYVMSHYELDRLVAKLAQKKGVKIVLKKTVSSFPGGFDRIIGCDGPNSFIRRNLGLPDPKFKLGILGFKKKKDKSNFVETWPVENGFIWKIPRVDDVEYGIIAGEKDAKKLFDAFLKKNKLKIDKLESGLAPQGLVMASHPAIALCGDAMGLTKPWSGGGVIWGFIAADLLLKNFPDFIKYRNDVKRSFGPRIVLSKLATRLVYFFGHNAPWVFPGNIKIESDFLL